VVPHIGKIPMVTPRAAEKASCLGSAPLHGIPTEACEEHQERVKWMQRP
jgi:hypothetical protein